MIWYREEFSLTIYAISSMSVFFESLGSICFARALFYGNAGPVTAIVVTKAIVQSMLAAIFLS